MAYDGSLNFNTSIDAKGFQQGANLLASIASGMVVFSIIEAGFHAITAQMDDAIARFDTLERFPRIMEQMGFSAELAESSVQQLSDGLQGLPTALDSVVGTTNRIASMTDDLQYATDLTLALNNAFLASGSGADGAARGTEQYLQIIGRGMVEMEEWRTLQETMPYALKQVAESFGFAGDSATMEFYSALQTGQITVEQFSRRMIELSEVTGGFADLALTASDGIDTAMTNIRITVIRGLTEIVSRVDDSLESVGGISGALNNLKPVIFDAFTVAADVTEVLANNMDLLAIAAGGVTTALIAQKVVTAASAALTAYNTAAQNAVDTGQLLTVVLTKNSAARATNNATVTLGQALIGALTSTTAANASATGIATAATTAWNTAWAANPIGLTIGIVTAATIGIYALTTAIQDNDQKLQAQHRMIEEQSEAYQALTDAVSSSADAYDEETRAIQSRNNAMHGLFSELDGLLNMQERGIDVSAQMAFTVAQINDLMPELGMAYNQATGELTGYTSSARENADALSAQEQAQRDVARATELRQSISNINDEIEEQTALMDGLARNPVIDDLTGEVIGYSGAYGEVNEVLEGLNEQLRIQEQELEGVSDATLIATEAATTSGETISELAERYGTTTEAIEAFQQETGYSLDEFAEMQEAATARVQAALETMVEGYYNANDRISYDNTLSAADLIANLAHNQEAFENYAMNLQSIADLSAQNGLSLHDRTIAFLTSGTEQAMAFMNELAEMSTEQALNSLTQLDAGYAASTENLGQDYAAAFGALSTGVAQGMEDAATEAEAGATEIAAGIQTATPNITESATTIVAGIAAEFDTLGLAGTESGNNLISGLLNAMSSGAGSLYAKADEIANTVAETLRRAWDEHSPSKVSYGIMAYFMDGLTMAMDDGKRTLQVKTLDLASSVTDGLSGLNPLNMSAIDRAFPSGAGGNVTNYYFEHSQTINGMENITESKLTAEALKLQERLKWRLP